MSPQEPNYATSPVEPSDVGAGFACGKHPLDDYFSRHALANDMAGIGRVYVMRRAAGDASTLPKILGFYTLSMALADAAAVGRVLERKLPRYPMPVALIGRLAVDARSHGRRIGERLLLDALRRIVDASVLLGCVGAIVDAKDVDAELFYAKYDFVTVSNAEWPHRMFLPIATIRAAFDLE
ncbi:MAG: hypothetical protein NDI82_01955 [Anaeromyxobacteraceae bacterium]|nr:hypothetical protein [Anaeromyxobacteraceae bacterium]